MFNFGKIKIKTEKQVLLYFYIIEQMTQRIFYTLRTGKCIFFMLQNTTAYMLLYDNTAKNSC